MCALAPRERGGPAEYFREQQPEGKTTLRSPKGWKKKGTGRLFGIVEKRRVEFFYSRTKEEKKPKFFPREPWGEGK